MENRISTTIAKESLTKINKSIDELDKELSFLINLGPEDRKGGFRLGDKNLGFLLKAKDYINQNPEFLPGYVSAVEVTKDTVLAEQLNSILRKLGIILDKIEDTANIAGMEALAGALSYYNAVKDASKNNIESAGTIYDDLSKRFPSTRRSKTEASE